MHLRPVTVNTEFGDDIVLVQLKPGLHKDLAKISSHCEENQDVCKNASEHFANIENILSGCLDLTSH